MAAVTLRIPRHVAVIMDGNGRWAKQRGLPRSAGHKAGAESVRRLVEACDEFGVKYLTLYAFTENAGRPRVKTLMSLLKRSRTAAEDLIVTTSACRPSARPTACRQSCSKL